MRPGVQRAYLIQFAVGKEALGDAYKKMKQHKQALNRYEEALSDLDGARKLKEGLDSQLMAQLESHCYKVKLKIAMSHYYQGEMAKSTGILR